jgi:hypothetical protein
MQVNLDGIEAKFLERTLETHLIFGDGDIDCLEGGDNFSRSDATVQVAFIVRVGFDRDRLLGDLICQGLQAAEALLFYLFELGLMLFDHSLVMIIGDDRKPLGKQKVVCKPWFDFDYIALPTEMVNVLNEQQFNAAILSFGQTLERLEFRYHLQLTSSLIQHEFHGTHIESTALAYKLKRYVIAAVTAAMT